MDRTPKVIVNIQGTLTPVPVTAWIGYRNGEKHAYAWYSSQGQADIALKWRKIDAARPARNCKI